MSNSFFNIYQNNPNPLVLLDNLRKINYKLGFNLNYDPESNKISLNIKFPKTNNYIEIFLPYDFDIYFFLPQFIELNTLINNFKKTYFIIISTIEEMVEEIKKIIITILIENNYCDYDKLVPLTEQNKAFGDFIFSKEDIIYLGSINFSKGNINILTLPST